LREIGPATRALIEAVGRADGSLPEARVRVRAAVAARCASAAPTSSGKADGTEPHRALGQSGSVAVAGKVVVVVAALAMGGAFAIAHHHAALGVPVNRHSGFREGEMELATARSPVAKTMALSPVGSTDAVASPATASPTAAPLPAPSVALPSDRTSRVRDATSAARQRPKPAGAQPARVDVAAEVLLLGRAREAMNARDPSAALALLDEHARRYPSGALTEERQAAFVPVLCALGHTGEARAARDHFLAAYSKSPYADTVRVACSGNAPPIGSQIPGLPETKETGKPTPDVGGRP
jgi:hypothetical protein